MIWVIQVILVLFIGVAGAHWAYKLWLKNASEKWLENVYLATMAVALCTPFLHEIFGSSKDTTPAILVVGFAILVYIRTLETKKERYNEKLKQTRTDETEEGT